MRKAKDFIHALLSISFVFFIWWYLTKDISTAESYLFPSPVIVWQTFERNFTQTAYYSFVTWRRIAVGLFFGGVVGFLTGLCMSASKVFYTLSNPLIELLRPIPPIALSPFFIIWFGLGDFGQLLMISMTTFMIITVGTFVAASEIPAYYMKAAQSLGATKYDMYRTVVIPFITPTLLGSARVASASAFGVTIAAEYLGAQGGLGYMIRNARVILDTGAIMVAAIILGLLSALTDLAIRALFSYFTQWTRRWEN